MPRRGSFAASLESPAAAGLLLALFTLAVYAPSFAHGFVYDDYEVILAQQPLASAADLARVFVEPHGLPSSQLPYYRAIPRATLLLQKTWHGDVAAPFHVLNAALGAAAGLAAFALLRLPALAVPTGLAALAGALYAVHPVTSSVVYPISSGRETLLPGVLWMIATWGFLRGGARGRWVAILGYAAALAGKEQAIVLPAVFVLADLVGLAPEPPGRSPRRWLSRYAPFAAVLIGYLALRAAIMPGIPQAGEGPSLALDATGPIYSALYALSAVFAPSPHLAYEPPLAVWWSAPRVGVAVALGLALAVAAALQGALARRRLVFWIGHAAASLVLTANVFPQETQYDERFVFLALLAPIAVAAGLAAPAWTSARGRVATAAVALALLALASYTTVRRGEAFRSAVDFGRAWVASNPAYSNAHFSLGTALAREGHAREAAEHLRLAVRLAPRYAPARYNLAVVLTGEGRLDEAVLELEALAALEPANPEPLLMLAVIRERQGRREDAQRYRVEAERRAVPAGAARSGASPGGADPRAADPRAAQAGRASAPADSR